VRTVEKSRIELVELGELAELRGIDGRRPIAALIR
jgi:hypothetical protein